MNRTESSKSVCPLCKNPLGAEEKQKLDGQFEELIARASSEKLKEAEDRAKKNVADLENKVIELKDEKDRAVEKERSFFKEFFENQLEIFKKQFEEQAKKDKVEFEKENGRLSKDLQTLKSQVDDEADRRSKQKIGDVTRDYEQKLSEKNIQLARMETDINSLKKTAEGTPGELRGTAGEKTLLDRLEDAFPQDVFKPQKRGQKTGDIIHEIRLDARHKVLTPIVYDNKEDTRVTSSDLEKAKRYKNIHNTNHVIIVSSHLPKEIGNGLIDEKDGVLIVHPKIIIGFVRQLRQSLIEIQKTSLSHIDRDRKEARLFDYLKSQEFERAMRDMETNSEKIDELQDVEEKDHYKLWELRKRLLVELEVKRRAIDAKITSFIRDSKEPVLIGEPAIAFASVVKNKQRRKYP